MIGNSAAGILGIAVQIAFFSIVVISASRRRGLSLAMVYGAIGAIFGYSLLVSFLALLDIPWQVTNVLLALAVGFSLLFVRTRLALAEGFPLLVGTLRRGIAAVVVVAVVLLFQLIVGAIEPELSIDGQLYHGPVLANLVQSGSLWGWSAPNQYVYYTDLTMAGGVNLATFTGVTSFDNSIQIPHLLLMIMLINWALARRFSSPFLRVSLATLMVVAPVIWLQPRILYVDLAYGVAVVASVFIVVMVDKFRKLDVLILGVAIGAVMATKPAGILTGMLLLAVAVVVVLVCRRRVARLRDSIGVIALGIGVPLSLAMSFYLRNLIQFQNPVYPIQAKFGPIVLPGILDLSIFTSGERGTGLVDPGRLISFAKSLLSGVLYGVTKLDYDPRFGGNGQVPLFVLAIALALIAVQIVVGVRAKASGRTWIGPWKMQLALVGLAAAILLVQPSTFDTRYVIGPTIVFLVAALLASAIALPTSVQLIAAAVALAIAAGQVVWTERMMYPGIKVALDIMQGPAVWRPNTPGNPSGRGLQVAWLPSAPGKCVSIALQTAGGVGVGGMSEASFLGTFSYGLYGDELCNRVYPVTINRTGGGDPDRDTAAIIGSDYLVLYPADVGLWEKLIPALARCLTEVDSIPGSESYPQAAVVLRNTCL